MIFVNYKTYEEGTGERALALTKILERVSQETQVKIIPVVQASDIKEISSLTTLEIWVQKVDPAEFGAHTGAIIPEAVLEDGAMGTFLNHSETRISGFDELAKASDRAKEAGLKTLIFAKDLLELENVCSLSPTFVAYETPELIGNVVTSVAQAQPDAIQKAHGIANAAGIPLVIGAGIHSREDVRKSLELGAVGVAVATDVVRALDPQKELLDLTEGFR